MKARLCFVAVAALLAACGGGGSGGPALSSPSALKSTPEPGPADAPPQPAQVADDFKTCITSPQAGSTADVGHAHEGVWSQPGTYAGQKYARGVMYAGTDGFLSGYQALEPNGPSFDIIEFRGAAAFSMSTGTWEMPAGTTSTGFVDKPIAASGTFTPKTSINGTYSVNGAAAKTFGPWEYDQPSNSLALTFSMLVHTWTGPGFGSFIVAEDGTVTGSTPRLNPLGACTITGHVALTEPGTKKNRLSYELNFAHATDKPEDVCNVVGPMTATGHVQVAQTVAADGSCKRRSNLTMFVRDAQGRMRTNYGYPYDWS